MCSERGNESLHQPNGEDEEREGGGGGNGKEARMPGQSDTESILSQSKTQEQDDFLLSIFFSFPTSRRALCIKSQKASMCSLSLAVPAL